ncbi:protein Shroom4 isoform X2 [Mugil cephalus]|uniref:protein Shroom4 isoform X2 n=1 Tax=Mugil cephalus TaxID=48193 RepID=UPI001FB570FE|nr:protein Shroom4 isoform X2 [Mugil cephalus]
MSILRKIKGCHCQRTVFPKDYYVVHRFTRSMLCDTDPCCVFPAAVVLLDSWHVLLRNLWDEHLNHSLILDLKQTLDTIIRKNRNTERFQEETDLTDFPTLSSSPEELLKLTSELFSKWLEVGCMPLIETCTLPTLPPSVERKDYGPSRARLLTTRAISNKEEEEEEKEEEVEEEEEEVEKEEEEVEEEGQPDKMIDFTQPVLNGGPLPRTYSAFVWSPLLFRLYWWFLP